MTFKGSMFRKLTDIPNQEGFRFRGVADNGDILNCVVRKYKESHVVVDEESNELVYYRLHGWMKASGETK